MALSYAKVMGLRAKDKQYSDHRNDVRLCTSYLARLYEPSLNTTVQALCDPVSFYEKATHTKNEYASKPPSQPDINLALLPIVHPYDLIQKDFHFSDSH